MKVFKQEEYKVDLLKGKLGCFDTRNCTIELNREQNEFILNYQNGLIKTIKFADGFQQITITAQIPLPKINQNTYIREDIMTVIANTINTQELNTTMSYISQTLEYQIQYAIVLEHEEQLSKNIDQILLEMSQEIEKISTKAYYEGDENLDEWINNMLQKYETQL